MTSGPIVLVTGAGGFIGSHVLSALARRGAQPVALLRPGSRLRENGWPVVEADYRNSTEIDNALRSAKPATLVHTAWRLAAGSDYLDDPANLDDLSASLHLFVRARENGCMRILGVGTCLEYELSMGRASERTPLRPTTVYGASKAALFLAAEAWARTAGVSFVWARLYYPFGPGEALNRLIPTVTGALLRGERVATTTGRQRRSFIFVEDVADAIAAIALSDAEGAFNVGAEDALPVRELVDRLAGAVGRPDLLDIGALEPRPGDPAVLLPDTTRLRTVVGWQPSTALDDALQQTVSWWRANATTQ